MIFSIMASTMKKILLSFDTFLLFLSSATIYLDNFLCTSPIFFIPILHDAHLSLNEGNGLISEISSSAAFQSRGLVKCCIFFTFI